MTSNQLFHSKWRWKKEQGDMKDGFVNQSIPTPFFSVLIEAGTPHFSSLLLSFLSLFLCLWSAGWPRASSAITFSISPSLSFCLHPWLLLSAVLLCLPCFTLHPWWATCSLLHNVWASICRQGSWWNSLTVKVQVAYLKNIRKVGFDLLFCLVARNADRDSLILVHFYWRRTCSNRNLVHYRFIVPALKCSFLQ